MVMREFGGPIGLLLGALEGVLSFFLDLEIDPEALIGSGSATSWVHCGLCLSLLAASSCFRSFEVLVVFLLQPFLVDFDLPNRSS